MACLTLLNSFLSLAFVYVVVCVLLCAAQFAMFEDLLWRFLVSDAFALHVICTTGEWARYATQIVIFQVRVRVVFLLCLRCSIALFIFVVLLL